jgi:hypothetical protein
MFESAKDAKMKKAFLILVSLGFLLMTACQSGTAPAKSADSAAAKLTRDVQAPAQVASPAASPADRLLDDWATYLSGLPGLDAADKFKPVEEASPWQDFAKSINGHWTAFDTTTLGPMKQWAGDDLLEAGRATKTLFYPFGGPDFVTAFAFFPDAEKTVLMGLEPVGNMPEFDKRSAEWTEGFFKDLDSILADFLRRGYFVTKRMNEVFAEGRVDGALPIICFFLKRTGHTVLGIERLAPDAKGQWVETPYKRFKKRPKRPYGVRIDCTRPGDGRPRSVEYYSCDLSDAAFTKESPLYRLCDGYPGLTTYVKSASYLLHYSDFANIRGLILARSQFVLEDDTGIPYRYFKRAGWGTQLFGAYTKPVEDFSAVLEQPDLKEAYDDPAGNVKKLPFHFGYHWVSKIDNLLLFTRPEEKEEVRSDGK